MLKSNPYLSIKAFLVAIFILPGIYSFDVSASEPTDLAPWFCTTPGRKLAYVRRYGGIDKEKWHYTMLVEELDKEEGDRSALLEEGGSEIYKVICDFRKPSGASLYGKPILTQVVISPNGDAILNVAESARAVFQSFLPRANISSEGGMTVLPVEMNPGAILPDVSSQITIGALRYSININQRKVLRREQIRTPAGLFDCIVLSEHKTEKGLGRNRDVLTLTWYARGVGYVRHDTIDYDTRELLTTEVLESIEGQ